MIPTRRQPQEEFDKRNQEIWDDFHKGMSIRDMINKYDLSQARIYAIINRLKEKK